MIIAHSAALRPVAEEWAAYRRSQAGGGWETLLHEVNPEAAAEAQRDGIVSFIRGVAAARALEFPGPAINVLLLGDTDSGSDRSGIPTFHFPQTDPDLLAGRDDNSYASDDPYQLLDDGNGMPDVALGRIPARSPAEARAALAKVRQYEARAADPQVMIEGADRVTYIAGEAHFGMMDGLFETLFQRMVERMVPDGYDISMTYAKPTSVYCPPPDKVADAVMQRLGQGCVLFNYVGHGHATGLDSLHWGEKRLPILRVRDLERFPRFCDDGVQRPIAFLSCCSTGFFDLPQGRRCLAEEMFFQPDGPVAVIAASRVSHPYANTVLQMDLTKAMLVDRAPTVGLLDLDATRLLVRGGTAIDRELDAIATPIAMAGKWRSSLAGLRQMHCRMYNLLGDPAMRIRLPATIGELQVADGRVRGKAPGMNAGRLVATLQTARAEMAHPEQIRPVIGESDPELPAKAERNYAIANDRTIWRGEAEVRDGAFQFTLPSPLPDNAVTLRIVAVGQDRRLEPVTAIGSLRFKLRLAPPASAPGVRDALIAPAP